MTEKISSTNLYLAYLELKRQDCYHSLLRFYTFSQDGSNSLVINRNTLGEFLRRFSLQGDSKKSLEDRTQEAIENYFEALTNSIKKKPSESLPVKSSFPFSDSQRTIIDKGIPI